MKEQIDKRPAEAVKPVPEKPAHPDAGGATKPAPAKQAPSKPDSVFSAPKGAAPSTRAQLMERLSLKGAVEDTLLLRDALAEIKRLDLALVEKPAAAKRRAAFA